MEEDAGSVVFEGTLEDAPVLSPRARERSEEDNACLVSMASDRPNLEREFHGYWQRRNVRRLRGQEGRVPRLFARVFLS